MNYIIILFQYYDAVLYMYFLLYDISTELDRKSGFYLSGNLAKSIRKPAVFHTPGSTGSNTYTVRHRHGRIQKSGWGGGGGGKANPAPLPAFKVRQNLENK